MFLCLVCSQACAQNSTKRAPDVRYEPSPPEVVTAILRLADVGKDDIVYDLGCGDGRIVIAAARDFGAHGVGIDIDPRRIAESEENASKAGVTSRVEFREEDLFEADFHEATVVTLFLWPSLNLKLRPILTQQLKSGTRIVSYIHNMGDWAPEKEMTLNGERIYLWTISNKK
jgi:SAM-dependent methyltransferase